MIAHDRPCRECGYNLRGLFIGGNCPECGRIIGSGRRELQSNLIDAPKSWLVVLAIGLSTMCGAWIVLVGLLLVAHRWIPRTYDAQLVVGCIVGAMWSVGTLIVLRERPMNLRPRHVDADEARRTSMLRIGTALTQAAIIPAVMFDSMRLNGGHPITGVLAMVCGAAFVLGQIPLCYWLARVCEWSDDATLAHRFRSLGWAVALVAFLNVFVAAFRVSRVPPLVMFATYWGWLSYAVTAIAVLAVVISIAQMTLDIRWIFRNADSLADRDEARAARDAESAQRFAAAAELSKPAPMSPEAERLLREALTPADQAETSHAPSALPPPGVRPLNERVIPKAKDGAYRLEGEADPA
jgi:hypothetical protein